MFLLINSSVFSQFEPDDISGIRLWLIGDSAIENGGLVSEWPDLSPNNFDLIQNSSSAQPLKVQNSLNGHAVVRFDGVNDNLKKLFGQTFPGPITIFIVFANSTPNPVFVYDSGNNYLSMIYVANALYIQSGVPNISFPKIAPFDFSIFQSEYNGSQSKVFENGIQKLLGTLPVATLDGFTLGTRFIQDQYFFGGDVAEVVVFTGILSPANKSNMEAYFQEKYSSQIDLGADISTTNFCPVPISAPNGFNNLLWSTGETSSSINVSSTGSFYIQGTDRFGFNTYDTITVTFPTIPQPSFPAICDGQSLTWNADMGAGWTYLWSTGETTPSITFSNPGTYSVTVTDPFGCSKTSDPAIFGIDNYESSAFLGNDTSLCSGNQVALQVGSMETLEYFWNGNTSAGQQASFVVTASGDVTLESINVNGCVAQDTIQVTVSGVAPNADFSFSDLCGTETGAFTDLSVPAGSDPIATWSWDMGDLTNISTQNASHSYAASGLYTVQLYVESAGGCGDLHIETVNVYLPPTADFSVSGHCEDQQVDFASTSSDGDAAITTWSWNFDMPASGSYNFSSIPVPNRIFPDVATYDVSLVVTDANGCSDSLAQAVVIDPSATVDFTYSLACAGSAIQLTDGSSTLPGSTYNWSWPLGGSILQNPSTTFSAEGSYDVTLQVGNTFGCTSSLTKTIVVNPLPTINLNFGPHCAGTYMDATAVTNIVSGVVDSVQWIFEGTDFLTGANVDYLIQEIGQLEIEATAFSDQGCTSTVSQNLDVTSELYVSFTPEIGTAGAGDIFPFDNTSIGTNVALWNFGDGQFSSEFDANHIYDDQYIDSVMNVYLIGLNTEGCMDTAYGQISVQRPYLDLALEEIFVQAVGEWQIVGVRMRNTGTINVARADLWIETRAGRLVEETWTGLLSPGEDSIYIFTGKVQAFVSEQDVQDDFICVSGEGYNLANGIENDLTNNVACKDIEGEEAVLLPAYPNPADNDLKLQLLISKEETVQLYLSDALGQIVINVLEDQVLTPGLFSYALNLRNLRDGVYFIRMRTATIDLSEKVVVRD